MRLFGGDSDSATKAKARVPRHSSGWQALKKHLAEQESLRILDLGPTSSTNVNLLTSMGHSIYMADVVSDSRLPQWTATGQDGAAVFRTQEFLADTLSFGERHFDVVLFWDTADYVTPELLAPLVQRIHDVMRESGRLLALAHIRPEGCYSRYHLRSDDQVDAQQASELPVRNTYTNRQIEQIFASFSSYRFFLAKDNLREILVSR